MKKLLILALLAFHCFGTSAQVKPTLAIYAKLYTDDTQVSLNPLVAELTGRLMDNYTLVSRMEKFQALVDKELIHQASGRVDDEMLVKLGKEFGADNVCAVFVEYNKASNAYFYWVEVISTQNRDIKRMGRSNKSDLSISKQQDAAKEILEQLFPPIKLQPEYSYSRKDLLYNEGMEVYDYEGNEIGESRVLSMLYRSGNNDAIRLYNSAVEMKDSSAPTMLFLFGGIFGSSALVLDIMWAINPDDEGLVISGSIMTAATGAFIATGVILKCLPKKRLTKALKIYNAEIRNSPYYSPSLSFGPTPSGVGLCLKF